MQGEVLQPPSASVIDVTDADFMERVVDESKRRPVLVDFWADWCGPCKQLSPVLERLAQEKGGRFLLAKMDVDRNQYTAAQFRVQSIPNVWAFVDGRPIDQFIGALPEQAVRQFIDRLLPTEADLEAAQASRAVESGDVEAAEGGFRDVLREDPDNRDARLGLARILADRGDLDEARDLVTSLLPDPEAERVLSRIRECPARRPPLGEPGRRGDELRRSGRRRRSHARVPREARVGAVLKVNAPFGRRDSPASAPPGDAPPSATAG